MRFFIPILLLLAVPMYARTYRLTTYDSKTDASFRGLSVVTTKVAWVSGTHGYVGITVNGGKDWVFRQIKGFESCDFRSLYAFDRNTAVIATAGTPACVLRTENGGKDWKVVYKDDDTAAFFDGIDFWNKSKGVIYGDPVHGKGLQLLFTADGGRTWHENPAAKFPALAEGEASFAASGTCIRCLKKKKVVIATGGVQSRIHISDDRGVNWSSVSTPVIQGQKTTGIFSMAFRNSSDGIFVGGDYKRDTARERNVFYTRDGGFSWEPPATGTRGYRECVEYLDKKNAIALGPTGIDVSSDGGRHWNRLSDEQQLHVVRKSRRGNLILFAGGKGKVGVIQPVD